MSPSTVGRIQVWIWWSVATSSIQEGPVETTQPRALVTRPVCSWMSACASMLYPGPPSLSGMLIDVKASSRACSVCSLEHVLGDLPPVHLRLYLPGDQLVDESTGPVLELPLGGGELRAHPRLR